VHSELVVGSIYDVHQDADKTMSVIARIDRGRDDGIVVGTSGHVWSLYSKSSDGHERELAQLGTGEVMSVDQHTALVRIRANNSKGDGLIRKDDLVELKARTPDRPDRSSLWAAAKFNITFLDANDRPFFDYGSLYSDETSESDSRVVDRMVQDIRSAAPSYSDQPKLLETGAFAGQSVQQAMLNCNAANLNQLVDFVVKYPKDLAGKRYTLSKLYALWVQNGAP
jgi:hypothetical protein